MGSQPVKVAIVYCSECGYETQALDLIRALMLKFGHNLSSITIIPWVEGSFDVSVNGKRIHSMMEEGGFPEHSTIIDAIQAQLDAAAEVVESIS